VTVGGDVAGVRPLTDPQGPEHTGTLCPKHMVNGPCGGVRPDLTCEVDGTLRCPFVDGPLVRWGGPTGLAPPPPRVPRVMTDLRVPAYDVEGIRRVAAVLGLAVDAILVGEHQNRPDFPPAFVAALLLEQGATPWPVLTCRDRNRVALDAELAALASLAVAGVHCVTGDAPPPTAGRGAAVFDVDGMHLTAMAAARGLQVSVAATPAAPPAALRPQRLVEKQRAGASVVIVNHAGGPAAVSRFVAAARAAGCRLPFVACVPIFTDAASATVISRFPGVVLDGAEVAAVLGAPDPEAAGIEAAAAQAAALLRDGVVAGVDLSGSASAGDELRSAAILAATARRVRELVAA